MAESQQGNGTNNHAHEDVMQNLYKPIHDVIQRALDNCVSHEKHYGAYTSSKRRKRKSERANRPETELDILFSNDILNAALWEKSHLPESSYTAYRTVAADSSHENGKQIAAAFIADTADGEAARRFIDSFVQAYLSVRSKNEKIKASNIDEATGFYQRVIMQLDQPQTDYLENQIEELMAKQEAEKERINAEIEKINHNRQRLLELLSPERKEREIRERNPRVKREPSVMAQRFRAFLKDSLELFVKNTGEKLRRSLNTNVNWLSVFFFLVDVILYGNVFSISVPEFRLRLFFMVTLGLIGVILPYFFAKHISEFDPKKPDTLLRVILESVLAIVFIVITPIVVSYLDKGRFSGNQALAALAVPTLAIVPSVVSFFLWRTRLISEAEQLESEG